MPNDIDELCIPWHERNLRAIVAETCRLRMSILSGNKVPRGKRWRHACTRARVPIQIGKWEISFFGDATMPSRWICNRRGFRRLSIEEMVEAFCRKQNPIDCTDVFFIAACYCAIPGVFSSKSWIWPYNSQSCKACDVPKSQDFLCRISSVSSDKLSTPFSKLQKENAFLR